jgi:surface antigen
MKKLIALATAAALLSGCAQNGQRGYSSGGQGLDKEMVGGLAGAAGGAVLGAQFGKGNGRLVGVALGTLLGAKLGSEVGSSLDRADMTYYNQTSQQALETAQPGQALPWTNPQSGNSGTFTPSNYYQSQNGQYCREYSQSISVGGQISQGYGTACRQPDGTWQIMK